MQRQHDGSGWILRLDDGDDLVPALTTFATEERVGAAVITSGIGGLRRLRLGFWTGQEYSIREFPEFAELIALHGSIARADNAPSIHLHVAIGRHDYSLAGGHLIGAEVANLAEIAVRDFPGRTWGRSIVESLGLRVLDLEPGPNP